MRRLLYLAVAGVFLILDWNAAAAVAAKKKAPAKKTSVARKTSTSKKATTARKTSSTRKTSSRRRTSATRRKTTWRNRQLTPTPERYKEIQDALVARGYLGASDATGSWSASSVDALKHFQADQNIEASGKINSLSLIALGLGPKREPVPSPPPPSDPGQSR